LARLIARFQGKYQACRERAFGYRFPAQQRKASPWLGTREAGQVNACRSQAARRQQDRNSSSESVFCEAEEPTVLKTRQEAADFALNIKIPVQVHEIAKD
jgi:hypothetical protein